MDETGRERRARKLTHEHHATDISGWGLLTVNGATVLSPSTKWYVLAGLSRHIRAGSQILNTTAAFAIASYSAGARTLAVWATNADASAPLPLVVDLSSFSSACRGLSVARFATDFNGKGDLYTRYDDTVMSGASFAATLKPASAQTFVVEGC
jgi:galactan endo-1,6-beta-galactosidase